MAKTKEWEVLTSVSHEIPEHQFLLAFNNDDDCIAFNEWWTGIGEELFEDYLTDRNF